jgi:hypothetical protein
MNDNPRATADLDALLNAFAAELTRAAYHVALRHGPADAWLDLQLDLWQAITDMVKQWGQRSPPDHLFAVLANLAVEPARTGVRAKLG